MKQPGELAGDYENLRLTLKHRQQLGELKENLSLPKSVIVRLLIDEAWRRVFRAHKKFLPVALLFFLAVPARAENMQATSYVCQHVGLYAFALKGCPQEEIRPRPDLTIPLCEQPGFEQWAYLDHRCYVEVPFDFNGMCYEAGCAVPYDHVFVSMDGEHYRVERGSASEIDQHYRACRKNLGEALGK